MYAGMCAPILYSGVANRKAVFKIPVSGFAAGGTERTSSGSGGIDRNGWCGYYAGSIKCWWERQSKTADGSDFYDMPDIA